MSVDKSAVVQCDQIVILKGHYAKKDYSEKIRRIRYFDSKNNKTLVYLTSHFTLPSLTRSESLTGHIMARGVLKSPLAAGERQFKIIDAAGMMHIMMNREREPAR